MTGRRVTEEQQRKISQRARNPSRLNGTRKSRQGTCKLEGGWRKEVGNVVVL